MEEKFASKEVCGIMHVYLYIMRSANPSFGAFVWILFLSDITSARALIVFYLRKQGCWLRPIDLVRAINIVRSTIIVEGTRLAPSICRAPAILIEHVTSLVQTTR